MVCEPLWTTAHITPAIYIMFKSVEALLDKGVFFSLQCINQCNIMHRVLTSFYVELSVYS